MKKFTTYQVMRNHVAVRRRYSDFEWLLTALQSRFVGMLLPPLPEKKAIKTDDSVIRSRVRGLNLFLTNLVANEYVQNDPDLRSFLTLTDSGAWENAKRQHVAHAMHEPSAGLLKWRELLDRSEPPANLDRVLVELKQNLEPVIKVLQQLCTATKRLADRAGSYAAGMSEMETGWVEWAAHERTANDTAERPSAVYGDLDGALTHSSAMFRNWKDILTFQPSINELLLHENIKFQMLQMCAMRELLKQREVLIDKHNKASQKLEKLRGEQQNAASRGKTEKVAKLERDITAATSALELAKTNMDMASCGLAGSEIQRFHREKNALLRELMGQLSAAHFQFAKRLGVMWQGFLGDMKVDPHAMVEKARVVFSQAASCDGFDAGDE